MKKILTEIVIAIFGIYMTSVMIMVPYYNWKFAQENGFIKWLYLGQVIPTIKAVVWPYYVFFENSNTGDQRLTQDWVLIQKNVIGINGKATDVYYNKRTLQYLTDEKVVSVWEKDFIQESNQEMKWLKYISCQRRELTVKSFLLNGQYKDIPSRVANKTYGIEPDTTDELIYRAVCK